MKDTRKACLEPVSWLFVGPYWNARQGLLNDKGERAVGAVVGRIHPAVDKEKGKFWWVAAPWCGGHNGEENGYAQTLEEAKSFVEVVTAKSPMYTVRNTNGRDAMTVRARDLIGREIVAVDFQVFSTGRGQDKTTNPVLTLDNGKKLGFVATETEVGEYGIELILSERRKA